MPYLVLKNTGIKMIRWELECRNCKKLLGVVKEWPKETPTQIEAVKNHCDKCLTAWGNAQWTCSANDIHPAIVKYLYKHGVVCDETYDSACRCTWSRAKKALLRHCQGEKLLKTLNYEVLLWK